MQVAMKKFRLTGTMPILGSVSMDKELFTKFIASKAATSEEKKRAREDVDKVEDMENSQTGFYRDTEGNLIMQGYQIKGFLKSAAKALKDQLGLASCVSKIDNFVFIQERNIPIMKNGSTISEPDGTLERPLRAETAQGPRVALSKSEMVDEGWYADITVQVLNNKGTPKSAAITMDLVEELLSYGELKGLLQWRNAGYGSFTFEEIE